MLAVTVGMLVAAGPAAASTLRVAASHGDVRIWTRQSPGVYRTTVYVPGAYWLTTPKRVAGPAAVRVTTKSGPQLLRGRIRAADPRAFAGNNCAADKGYHHLAVWVLAFGRVQIPIYVDPSFDGTTALTWCASRATHLRVTAVSFTLDPVFTVRRGTYVWHAVFDHGTASVAEARVRQ